MKLFNSTLSKVEIIGRLIPFLVIALIYAFAFRWAFSSYDNLYLFDRIATIITLTLISPLALAIFFG